MMRHVWLLAWTVCAGLTFAGGALAQSSERTAAEDDVFWESVSGCTDAVEVELYIEEFGEEGRHVAEARACLETLRKAVPDTAGKKTPSTEVERLLEVCEMHFAANRLTTGVGGTAVQCYREVQSLDPANRQAVEGLQRVFGKYAAWARAALEREDAVKARGHVEKLKGLNPEAPEVAELEGAIARLEKQGEEEQENAEPAPSPIVLEKVEDILSLALQAARGVQKEHGRAQVFAEIAEAQAAAGDARGAARSLSDAREAAQWEESGIVRRLAFNHIVEAQAANGDVQGALTTARGIEDGTMRDWAVADIAKAQAEAGDIQGALTTARGIEGKFQRDRVFSDVARAQAEAGDIQGALTTARGIGDGFQRARAFSDIARAQAAAGDARGAARSLSDAREAAQGIGAFSWRARAFSDIARAQAETGNTRGAARSLSHAREDAEREKNDSDRIEAFADIAKAQAATGDARGAAQSLSDAREDAQREGNRYSRALAFAHIATAQAANGDIQGALTTARGIGDGFQRALAFADIAKTQAAIGDVRGAARSLSHAREDAQRVGRYSRAMAFAHIAKALIWMVREVPEASQP